MEAGGAGVRVGRGPAITIGMHGTPVTAGPALDFAAAQAQRIVTAYPGYTPMYTVGRAVFNMNPDEAIAHFQYERVPAG